MAMVPIMIFSSVDIGPMACSLASASVGASGVSVSSGGARGGRH